MVITIEVFDGVESLDDNELIHTLKTLLEPNALRAGALLSVLENLDVDDISTLRAVPTEAFVSPANMGIPNIGGVTLMKLSELATFYNNFTSTGDPTDNPSTWTKAVFLEKRLTAQNAANAAAANRAPAAQVQAVDQRPLSSTRTVTEMSLKTSIMALIKLGSPITTRNVKTGVQQLQQNIAGTPLHSLATLLAHDPLDGHLIPPPQIDTRTSETIRSAPLAIAAAMEDWPARITQPARASFTNAMSGFAAQLIDESMPAFLAGLAAGAALYDENGEAQALAAEKASKPLLRNSTSLPLRALKAILWTALDQLTKDGNMGYLIRTHENGLKMDGLYALWELMSSDDRSGVTSDRAAKSLADLKAIKLTDAIHFMDFLSKWYTANEMTRELKRHHTPEDQFIILLDAIEDPAFDHIKGIAVALPPTADGMASLTNIISKQGYRCDRAAVATGRVSMASSTPNTLTSQFTHVNLASPRNEQGKARDGLAMVKFNDDQLDAYSAGMSLARLKWRTTFFNLLKKDGSIPQDAIFDDSARKQDITHIISTAPTAPAGPKRSGKDKKKNRRPDMKNANCIQIAPVIATPLMPVMSVTMPVNDITTDVTLVPVTSTDPEPIVTATAETPSGLAISSTPVVTPTGPAPTYEFGFDFDIETMHNSSANDYDEEFFAPSTYK
jgi:hypothetical protein